MSEDPNAHLITRDPEQMEQQLESAEYAGAAPQPTLGTGEAALLQPSAGLGVSAAAGALREVNPNPGYTPPSQMSAPHPQEGAADLPAGAPAEAELERELGER